MTSRRSNVDCDLRQPGRRRQHVEQLLPIHRPLAPAGAAEHRGELLAAEPQLVGALTPLALQAAPGRSTGPCGQRVAKAAASLAAGPEVPWRSSSASISARRRLNARSTGLGTPATSAIPRRTTVHSTPSSRDSSDAQHGLVDEARRPRLRVQSAGHPASTSAHPDPGRGSPPRRGCAAADPRPARCGAGTSRPPGRWPAPRSGRRGRAGPPPPCAPHAPSPPTTASSCARRTASRTSGSPSPKSTLTLFGAENVKS